MVLIMIQRNVNKRTNGKTAFLVLAAAKLLACEPELTNETCSAKGLGQLKVAENGVSYCSGAIHEQTNVDMSSSLDMSGSQVDMGSNPDMTMSCTPLFAAGTQKTVKLVTSLDRSYCDSNPGGPGCSTIVGFPVIDSTTLCDTSSRCYDVKIKETTLTTMNNLTFSACGSSVSVKVPSAAGTTDPTLAQKASLRTDVYGGGAKYIQFTITFQ